MDKVFTQIRDCYFSPSEWLQRKAFGRESLTLGGRQLTTIVPHGTPHELRPDEVFVGCARAEDIQLGKV